jgi:hypothetical protein
LKQSKGVEVGAPKDAEGLRIQTEVSGEVGRKDRIGDTVKHGKDIEGREDGEDDKKSGGLGLFCHLKSEPST